MIFAPNTAAELSIRLRRLKSPAIDKIFPLAAFRIVSLLAITPEEAASSWNISARTFWSRAAVFGINLLLAG
jgi:predicted DNA-binding protein (UPF0251 family)